MTNTEKTRPLNQKQMRVIADEMLTASAPHQRSLLRLWAVSHDSPTETARALASLINELPPWYGQQLIASPFNLSKAHLWRLPWMRRQNC